MNKCSYVNIKEMSGKGKYYEDIYFSKKNPEGSWGAAVNVGPSLNTEFHEAVVSISKDGNKLFVYRDDKGDGNLYFSEMKNGEWSSLKKLDGEINSSSWESHAFLSADGKKLYFVSDRPGGYGGRDLYYSELQKNGKWGVSVNMGPVVNSPFDEDGPWVSDDGSKIIFSSNGHSTMGGFDIFTAEKNENGDWEVPLNMGYPVNSTDDDVFFTYAPDRNTIYYSSGKYNGFGNEDIYEMKIIGPWISSISLYGNVADGETGNTIYARVLISDAVNGNIVADEVSGYGEPGYSVSLSVGKTYRVQVSAGGYRSLDTLLAYTEAPETGEESRVFTMQPLDDAYLAGLKDQCLRNVFFDFNSAEIRLEDEVQLLNLISVLKDYPNLGIVVDAHTDNRGSYEYNLSLSERRAEAVKEFFTGQGIDANRILTSFYSYTRPVSTNENTAGRQLNRRAEFHLFFMSE